MIETRHDEESFAIGWISISDLLMIGTLSLLLVSRGLEVESIDKSSRIDELQGATSKLESQIEEIGKLLEETQEQVVVTEQELDKTKAQLSNSYIKLEESLSENSRLVAEIKRRSESESQLKQRVMNLSAEISAAQLEAKKTDEKIQHLSEMLQSRTNEIAMARRQLLSLWLARAYDRVIIVAAEIECAILQQVIGNARAELALANDLNGVLKKETVDLSDKLYQTDIRERGFRQELLGIKAKNNELNRVVFVVDQSWSMGGPSSRQGVRRWEYVKATIDLWIKLLPYQEVQLITYSNDSEVFPAKGRFVSLSGDPSDRSVAAQSLISRLTEPENEKSLTNTYAALIDAFQVKGDGEQSDGKEIDAIFLFTDGQPTRSSSGVVGTRMLQDEILDLIDSDLRPKGVPINVIGLGDYFNPPKETEGSEGKQPFPFGQFLVKMSEKSGGVFLGR